jgi:phage-related protein
MWPWDWIIGAGNAVAGVSQAVANWVSQIIASVVSWVQDAITSIWNTLRDLGAEISSIWSSVVNTIENAVSGVINWVSGLIQSITSWVTRGIMDLWNWVRGTWDWVTRHISDLVKLVEHTFSQVVDWVNREIFQPLYRLYTGIRDFFTGWIVRIWQYFEHPELLVALIGGALWRTWTQYVARYGAAVARFIIREMSSLQGEIYDLLENILTSIL